MEAASSRLPLYLVLVAAGLLAAVFLGRPEPALLVLPFAATLVLGIGGAASPRLEVRLELGSPRVLEGEEVTLTATVVSPRQVNRLDVRLRMPAAIPFEPSDGYATGLRAGEERRFEWKLRPLRWGTYRVGTVELTARDRIGLFTFIQTIAGSAALKVFPSYETLQKVLRPVRTRALAGNFVSRQKGDGIEYADIRPFGPGDPVRRVNWRISARRDQLHVNEAHPERNTDVVLFLDSFSDLRLTGTSSLDLAVRGASSLAEHYLARRDRVGLIGFGGTLRWLRPAMGGRQLYKIVDALLETEAVLSYAWKGVEVLPRQTLPASALVVAFSPLLDERILTALVDIRARGHDLTIVELSPLAYVRPGELETERLAFRLWQLQREVVRASYQSMGIPIVLWDPGQPFQAALEEVGGFRRQARLARV